MNLRTLCIRMLIHILHLLRDRNEMRAQGSWLWVIHSMKSVRLKTAIYQSLYHESCPKYLTKGFGCFIITLLYESLKSHDHKTISDSADLETMSLELRWIFLLIFLSLQGECGQLFSEMTFLRYHFNPIFYIPPVTRNAQ